MVDPELEVFKTSIDLRAYAAHQGYILDGKESSRGSAVMRHANGDKIVIKRDTDNHYVYFSVQDDVDHGTIIDFVKRRKDLNLGAIRKELRAYSNSPAPLRAFTRLLRTVKDRMRIEAACARMHDASGHPYLENERAIPTVLLRGDRFAGRVRIDARGNTVFPHFDREGVCGFEIKNRGFTGFAPGGSKALWLSQQTPDDNRLVICESAIDALSYAVLFPEDRTRYASIGGQLSPQQRELIRTAAAAMPTDARIIAATDEDAPGGKLADEIREAVALTGRDDLIFVLHQPGGFKDWNDQLMNRPKKVPCSRPTEPTVA